MPQSNVDLARNGYHAFLRDGKAALRDFLDPEIEVQTADELPEAGTYRGIEEVMRLFEMITEPFVEIHLDVEQVEGVGQDRVLVKLRLSGRGSGSRIEVHRHVFHLWTFRDGRAVRLRVYANEQSLPKQLK